MLEDDELEFCDVVRMHPIFGGLPHEVLLFPSGRGVSFDRVSSRADSVIKAGKLDNKGIVVVLEEGFPLETSGKYGFEYPTCGFLKNISSSAR